VRKRSLIGLIALLAGTAGALGLANPVQAEGDLPNLELSVVGGCGETTSDCVSGSTAPSAFESLVQSGDCAAYVDSAAWCEPGVEDYDCPDIPDQYKPLMLPDPTVDPFRLDRDNDSEGCELPGGGNASPDESNGDSGASEAPDEVVEGDLPLTGLALPVLGAGGVGALALGGGLLLLVRRRQVG
jgi:hypothetical protein